MTDTGFPRITVDPAVCGGRPIIAGTRVRVADILEMLAAGGSVKDIVNDFPYVGEEDVLAALGYAAVIVDRSAMLLRQGGIRSLRGKFDHQAILVADLDTEVIDAILTAEPGEQSKDSGQRSIDPKS